jgi:hypothetical protein
LHEWAARAPFDAALPPDVLVQEAAHER